MRKQNPLLFVLCLLLMTAPLSAQTKGIATFGGLKNLEFVNDYYNGGTGSLGSGPGRNFPLTFSSNAQVIVSANKGGSGNFINNPGGYPVLFFQTGTSVVVNAPSAISVGLWFTYSALQPGTATVYDGPNGTGNILASISLTLNNAGCTTYKMCVWSPVAVPLPTTPAGSIRFTGVANNLGINAIHMGVKIPTSIAVVSSQNPSMLGDAVTFTAAVSATGAAPVGTVTFKTGNKVAGTVPVAGGVASITLSTLPAGATKITAIFRGTGFVTSTATLTQNVN
ncbi:MAG TPA: Ig-like domain repeat protein [Terriglobales bacterium]|nr:Ig-like domain repeat protein [Terriglobales bacterium]